VLNAVTDVTDSGVTDNGVAESVMQLGDGVITGTITFGSYPEMKKTNKINDTPYQVSSDYKFRQSMTLKIDAQKIFDTNGDNIQDNAPGVYRYQIKDVTAADTYLASGVTDGGANDTIYLDVYVKYTENQKGLLVYGYVLLRYYEDGANTSITYTEKTDEVLKTDGYTTTSEGDDNGDEEVIPADLKSDRYVTYNVDIMKTAAGDLADRYHEFPFTVQLTNDTIKNGAKFSVNDGAIHRPTCFAANGKWSSTDTVLEGIDFKLKHGDMISLIGLPAGTMVLATEQNDSDPVYSVSVTCNENAKTLVNTNSNVSGNSISVQKGDTAAMEEPFLIKRELESDKVIFVNTLSDISITGLAFDIAPFLFMTASGVFLLVFFLRSRRKTDHNNVI
jgi:hypothetical protein